MPAPRLALPGARCTRRRPTPATRLFAPRRFSQYPQELTLRLDAPARLQQVQLLSHESKIAARVELLVGTFDGPAPTGGGGAAQGPAPAGADPGKATWRRLGFLTFDSNERSGFTARELKSVALADVPAHLVRLVFHRCHPNAQNIYSQARAGAAAAAAACGSGAGYARWVSARPERLRGWPRAGRQAGSGPLRETGQHQRLTLHLPPPPAHPRANGHRSAWWR